MIDRLEAGDIKKQYNATFRLECSLHIEKGLLYSIVGPNGSGKSTLLRILTLIERPDSGTLIYRKGKEVLPEPRRDMNVRRATVLVPSHAPVFRETVYKNMAYGLKLRHVPDKVMHERIMETLKDVGLKEKARHHAGQLSSGEAQRLSIARALVLDPDVLMLDEPTASLDPESTGRLEEIIRTRVESTGKITVMVTHNLYQARALSDFVICMHEGKVEEAAPAALFFESPASEMAKRFVSGEMY